MELVRRVYDVLIAASHGFTKLGKIMSRRLLAVAALRPITDVANRLHLADVHGQSVPRVIITIEVAPRSALHVEMQAAQRRLAKHAG